MIMRLFFLPMFLFGVQSMFVRDNSLTGMYYDYALASAYMADIYHKNNIDVFNTWQWNRHIFNTTQPSF